MTIHVVAPRGDAVYPPRLRPPIMIERNLAVAKSKAEPKKPEPKKPEAAAKPAPKAAAAKKTVAKPAAPLLTSDEIGPTAGLVWQTLNDKGGQTVAALKKSVDAPGDLVMAAVGWLAREGKLEFDASGRTVKISLR